MVEQNLKSGSVILKLLCVCIIISNCEASSEVPANFLVSR